MSWAPRALIGETQRRTSRPSKLVSMMGYSSGSSEKISMASLSMKSSIWSLSVIGPLSQRPAGTISRPPPCSESASMAFAKASVFRVLQSATPPKSVRRTLLEGIEGSCTFGISNGSPSYREFSSCAHASARIAEAMIERLLKMRFIWLAVSCQGTNIALIFDFPLPCTEIFENTCYFVFYLLFLPKKCNGLHRVI